MDSRVKPLVGLVGPCAAGKTTLCLNLQAAGINARHIAQEHSYVPDMWQRLTKPTVLVFLDVSYPLTLQRRNLTWTETEYAEEVFRLRHARLHAHFYLDTDPLTPGEVLQEVILFLDPYLLT